MLLVATLEDQRRAKGHTPLDPQLLTQLHKISVQFKEQTAKKERKLAKDSGMPTSPSDLKWYIAGALSKGEWKKAEELLNQAVRCLGEGRGVKLYNAVHNEVFPNWRRNRNN